MRIAIGSDHAGFSLKEKTKKYLDSRLIPYKDFGCFSTDSNDYPDTAVPVARSVAEGCFTHGILICATGIGMSIVANKISGVRAALCCSEKQAHLSVEHNNANILVMGGRITPWRKARAILRSFFDARFESGGRHERRVRKIHDLTGR
jgi:RpiB/LacA/LacB family sugar-phosphate isomerase